MNIALDAATDGQLLRDDITLDSRTNGDQGAKANPGKLNTASGGKGDPPHMSGELFASNLQGSAQITSDILDRLLKFDNAIGGGISNPSALRIKLTSRGLSRFREAYIGKSELKRTIHTDWERRRKERQS
jgi:hypothetical protein